MGLGHKREQRVTKAWKFKKKSLKSSKKREEKETVVERVCFYLYWCFKKYSKGGETNQQRAFPTNIKIHRRPQPKVYMKVLF